MKIKGRRDEKIKRSKPWNPRRKLMKEREKKILVKQWNGKRKRENRRRRRDKGIVRELSMG